MSGNKWVGGVELPATPCFRRRIQSEASGVRLSEMSEVLRVSRSLRQPGVIIPITPANFTASPIKPNRRARVVVSY